MDFLHINNDYALVLVNDREILVLSMLGFEFFELCLDLDDFNGLIEQFGQEQSMFTLPNKWAVRMFGFIDVDMNLVVGNDPDGVGLMSVLHDIKTEHEIELMERWN